MKLSEKSFPTSIEMYVGGLIYQEKLVATSFQWAEALQRFCSRSQGVVALVSVSDGKIQITILILRRGALSNQTDVSFTTILDEIVVSLKGKQEQIKTIKYTNILEPAPTLRSQKWNQRSAEASPKLLQNATTLETWGKLQIPRALRSFSEASRFQARTRGVFLK